MRSEKVGTKSTPSTKEEERPGLFRAPGSTSVVRNIDVMFVSSFPVLFLMFNIVYWFSLM